MLDKAINYLKLKFNRNLGFTLIELLITISIISILATVGVAIYNGSQMRSRDAKREADLGAITSALENNYNDISGLYSISNTLFSSGKNPTDPNYPDRFYCFYIGDTPGIPNPFRGDNPNPVDWLDPDEPPCPNVEGQQGLILPPDYDRGGITFFKICVLKEDNNTVLCRDNSR